jgi:pimeloyl-ACP methyl ester carboxylesterase
MFKHLVCTAALSGLMAISSAHAADTARHRDVLTNGDITLDVIVEGQGDPIVLLPSRGRDSEDYDRVAEGLVGAGYQVLRPQPRGIGKSTGPMQGVTLHDFANDTAYVIRHYGQGKPAIVVGHAFGNWVARMTAVDHPELVRGVVIAAAAAKQYPPALSEKVGKSADMRLPEAERMGYVQELFFAPGSDASVWKEGWYAPTSTMQSEAGKATRQSEWWSGGKAPLLDLQAADDPFKPLASRDEMKDEFGDRVTIKVIDQASHALIPEQPAAVVDAIVTWAKSLPPAKS